MKPRSPRRTFRQLTDLSTRQLECLRRVMAATKGMRSKQVQEVLHLVGAVRGLPR